MNARWSNFLVPLVLCASAASAATLVSRLPDGTPRGESFEPHISTDGRWVAYTAFKFLDRNQSFDPQRVGIWAVDLQSMATVKLSVVPSTGTSLRASHAPRLSADGRHLTFRVPESFAAEIAGGPVSNPHGGDLVAILDRDTDADGVFDEAGATRLSVLPDSGETCMLDCAYEQVPTAAPISDDGRFVAYRYKTATGKQVRLHDRDADADGVFDEADATTTTDLFDPATVWYQPPVMKGDGSEVWSGAQAPGASRDARLYRHQRVGGAVTSFGIGDYNYTGNAGAAVASPIAVDDAGTRVLIHVSGSIFGAPSLILEPATGTLVEIDADAALRGLAMSRDGGKALVVAGNDQPAEADGLAHYISGDYVYGLDDGSIRGLQAFDPLGRLVGFGWGSMDGAGHRVVASTYEALPGDAMRSNDVYLFDLRPNPLQVVVGSAPEAAGLEGVLAYPVTVTNLGGAVAHDVWVRARGPRWQSTAAAGGSFGGRACLIAPEYEGYAMVDCPVGDLAAGASVVGTVRFNALYPGLALVANATVEAREADHLRADNAASGSGTFASDASVRVTLPTAKKHRGDKVKATITVTNLAPSRSLSGLRIYPNLSGFQGQILSFTVGGVACPDLYASCALPTLANGASVVVTFIFVPKYVAQTVTVRASLSSYTSIIDRNTANNTATATKRIYR